jgi:hypothetical protein
VPAIPAGTGLPQEHPMTARHALATALAAMHLGLVVCGAVRLEPPAGPAGSAVRLYGALSGADNGFGFFAPGVASQVRIGFTARGAAGPDRRVFLAEDLGGEVKLRMAALLGLFRDDDEALRDVLAASWAGTVFGLNPDVHTVTVRVEMFDLPDMERYRRGERPHWVPIYEATLASRHEPSADEEPSP